MNIDRYMVNLFFEIKRNLPHDLGDPLKISSPTLGNTLINIYESVDNEATKRLIEVFFERAGADWLNRLYSSSESGRFGIINSPSPSPGYKSSSKSKRVSQRSGTQKTKPKVRYYRGAPVVE